MLSQALVALKRAESEAAKDDPRIPAVVQLRTSLERLLLQGAPLAKSPTFTLTRGRRPERATSQTCGG